MQIIYDKEMPDAVRREVEPILEKWRWLAPGWVQRLRIAWIPRSEDYENADCVVNYEYRWATIRIKGEWLDSKESQEFDIVHEMIHQFSNILANYARTEIQRLVPEDDAPKYRGALLDELAARHESFVQDLAWCLFQRHKG